MLLAAIALGAAAAAAPDWREFDRRQRGWVESPAFYDAASLERRGNRVRVWIFHEVALSGLPSPRMRDRVEADCTTRETRILEQYRDQGPLSDHSRRATPFAEVEDGSTSEALLRAVCIAP